MGDPSFPANGDYVVATKYRDGDPQDQFAIGFYAGRRWSTTEPDRHFVVDADGNQFRMNGFRRVKKISRERGRWLLNHLRDIESSSRSVWWWVRKKMDQP